MIQYQQETVNSYVDQDIDFIEFIQSLVLDDSLYTIAPLRPVKREQRPYEPRGKAANDVFYFKGSILGLSGPAGTGKSRVLLEKIHLLMQKYPGSRALIARKTRESISEAALFTFEEHVVPEGDPILANGSSRRFRQNYQYPNGSMIVIAGLDKPQKIMSTEFDIIYVQEFIECELNDLEFLMTRLRNGVIPYQQLLFDCNPDAPEHWIYQSATSGKFPLWDTYHEDNPTLWEQAPREVHSTNTTYPFKSNDGRIGRWTSRGTQYIEKLDALTGSNKARLRFGKWESAEGVIYPEWSREKHVRALQDLIKEGIIPPEGIPNDWQRIWVVDFGTTNPFVWLCFAIDPDGRMIREHEIYKTQTLVEDHARKMLEIIGYRKTDEGYEAIRDNPEPFPFKCLCDWDAGDRLTLEKYTGFQWDNACKAVDDGIQAVSSRLRADKTGKPRIIFLQEGLDEVDPELQDRMLPVCTVQEFPGYVWDTANGIKPKVKPLKKNDHGCDTTRYAIAFQDDILDKFDAKQVTEISIPLTRVVAVPNNIERTGFANYHRQTKERKERNRERRYSVSRY